MILEEKSLLLIINPTAGASPHRRELDAFNRRLRATGWRVERRITAGPGDGIRWAAETPARAVVAVGGDGTVREVAEGLIDRGAPLLIWPTGTENLVARAFGFRPRADDMLACLTRGRSLPVDVGIANGRTFLVVAGAGFDAEVVHRLARSRRGHITHLSYAGPIFRTFMEHRFPWLRVFVDDRLDWQGQGMVLVGNLPEYAVGLPVIRDAVPDDGQLDLCVFSCRNKLDLIGHSVRTLLRTHVEHHGVHYRHVTRVRIESPKCVPVELDGDAAGALPLDIRIRPGALRVLMPAPDGPAIGTS